jgi:hypothetical protein
LDSRTGTGRNRYGLGDDFFDGIRDFGPDRIDQCVVKQPDLLSRRLVEQDAESRDPVLVRMRSLAQHGIRDAGLAETGDLLVAAELFDPEIRRIVAVRIDQDGCDAGATEHRSGGRAGKAAADDGNIGIFHEKLRGGGPHHCPRKGK